MIAKRIAVVLLALMPTLCIALGCRDEPTGRLGAPTTVPVTYGTITQIVPGLTVQDTVQITLAADAGTSLNDASSPTVRAAQGVTVQSDPTNTLNLKVGSSPDLTHGTTLVPGASITYPVDDPATIKVWAPDGGQKVNCQWL